MTLSSGTILTFLMLLSTTSSKDDHFLDDICGHINEQRIYLDYGETGLLEAKYRNNAVDKYGRSKNQKRCTVEFISCPSCIVHIRFRFLNLSRNCGRSTLFDSCGCDYVWIYEPSFEQSSEQFCGRFISSNLSNLEYKSQTRKVRVEFLYNRNYQHAFTLDYASERNQILITGFPKFGSVNNGSQTITTPFFPDLYPPDLTMEHVINCESLNESCRISLVFTDFLLAPSTIIDFFDWNSERIYVTTGNIFRPPVITASGPSLAIRFYANEATNLGFKAYYSFVLGHDIGRELTPNINCGGQVNNLGGDITMMNMVTEGLKSFDCIWLIKPPETYLHMKTHLYVKVVNFSGFAGNTELIIRQGLTSNGPIIENIKLSPHLYSSREDEHIVPTSQGFYIRLKGVFRPESRLALVYAAFNYKECLAGSDFLCQNKRCISALLNCDGFDHCGDNSDEFATICSQDPRDRRRWSKTPHFLFPKVNDLSELAASSLVFVLSSFGLIGFIFVMVALLYKINIKTRHQRHILDHIEAINAILEEGVGVVEEEIIIPDDPPDYEAPPNYDDVVKAPPKKRCLKCKIERNTQDSSSSSRHREMQKVQGTSRSCQTTPTRIPDSPPPAYDIKDQYLPNAFFLMNCRVLRKCQWSLSRNVKNLCCENFSMYRRVHNKSKYFSDSELNHLLHSDCSSCKYSDFRLKRSFTTDDVDSFI